jgi:hypothetical protein
MTISAVRASRYHEFSMLEFTVLPITHNSVNSGCLSVIPSMFHDAPDFGKAINSLTLKPFFDDEKNEVTGGEASFQQYRLHLQELPTFKFSRRNKNLTIEYFSRVCFGTDLQRQAMARDRDELILNNSAHIFRKFYAEMLAVFEQLHTVIAASDDFDVHLFLSYLSQKRADLPKTNQALFDLWRHQLVKPYQPDIITLRPAAREGMSEEKFWQIIALTDQSALEKEREQEAVEPIIDKLSQLPAGAIESFHAILTEKLFALDTLQHFRLQHKPTDDGFLYSRCYVVGKGQKYYEQVLANPELMPKDPPWFEHLLATAKEAWAEVTDDDPLNFPSDVSDKSYETGSNSEGWLDPNDSATDS